MKRRELEQMIYRWTVEKTEQSTHNDGQHSVTRTHQLGLVIGLLASICEEDFYARQQIIRWIGPKQDR